MVAVLYTWTEKKELSDFDDDDYFALALAACCMYPDEYWKDTSGKHAASYNVDYAEKKLKRDDEKAQKVLNSATAFASVFYSLLAEENALNEDMTAFEEKFEKKHKEEVGNLNDWLLESSMYIELAASPSGSLIEYGKRITSYETNLTRFNKIANT